MTRRLLGRGRGWLIGIGWLTDPQNGTVEHSARPSYQLLRSEFSQRPERELLISLEVDPLNVVLGENMDFVLP